MDNILCDWRFDKLFAPLMDQFFVEASIIQRCKVVFLLFHLWPEIPFPSLVLLSHSFFRSANQREVFFFACNKSLERVSLKGGRYVTMGKLVKKDFPQWALIRFVRRTTSLKWFRSDLTQENIRLLSREKPEICFCNWRMWIEWDRLIALKEGKWEVSHIFHLWLAQLASH